MTVNKKEKLEDGTFVISRFIEACAMNEALAAQFMRALSQWDEAYCVAQVYEEHGLQGFSYNDQIDHSIIKNGDSWVEKEESRWVLSAFGKMNQLNECYYRNTGTHFKGFVDRNDYTALNAFMADFQHEYDVYMSGGHQDVLMVIA